MVHIKNFKDKDKGIESTSLVKCLLILISCTRRQGRQASPPEPTSLVNRLRSLGKCVTSPLRDKFSLGRHRQAYQEALVCNLWFVLYRSG